MPLISNKKIYPLTPLTKGSTWIGTDPLGRTVQYSEEELLAYMYNELDLLYINNATRTGQTVVINQPDVPESQMPTINNGAPCFGTIKTYPPSDDSHIDFITKLSKR